MSKQLRLDPIRCDGHGVCAELFPEGITLDDWGYPIVNTTTIPDALVEHAKRAVFACPVLALKLVEARERALTNATSRSGSGCAPARGRKAIRAPEHVGRPRLGGSCRS